MVQQRLVSLHPCRHHGYSNHSRKLSLSRRACIMVNGSSEKKWITTKEAADYLGLSESRIYHIKNHLTHRKGGSRTSRLYFLKNALIDDYLSM